MTLAGRIGLGGAALLLAGAGAALPFVAVVPDDEMAPSLLRGDWVVLAPRAPSPGEVVAVLDPLDPARWTLRRVESDAGPVRYEDGLVIGAAGEPSLLEMGRDEGVVTLQEGEHLVRHLVRPIHWEQPVVEVPEGWLWLGADNRDAAVDSRWWGPLPATVAQGTVVLRLGRPGHPWRGWVARAP